MKALLSLASLSLIAVPPIESADVATDYAREHTLRVTALTSLELETTAFEMTRDGEPVGGGFGGGGNASLEERTVTQTYRVLERDEGSPTRVQRAFETVSRSTTSERGDQTFEGGGEGPLQGVTLELRLEDGELVTEVVDGDEPSEEAALEGHSLTLVLDGFLPEGSVEDGDSWDLESDVLLHALGLDMEQALFPPEERAEPEEGGERGGRRGGQRGGAPRGSNLRPLTTATWSGKATFKGAGDHDGEDCVEIALELEAEGELPQRNAGGGGRRGGRMVGLAAGMPAAENTITCELEGSLLFSTEGGHPLLLELEGTVSTVSHNEFQRRESTMTMHTEQEGSLEIRVVLERE